LRNSAEAAVRRKSPSVASPSSTWVQIIGTGRQPDRTAVGIEPQKRSVTHHGLNQLFTTKVSKITLKQAVDLVPEKERNPLGSFDEVAARNKGSSKHVEERGDMFSKPPISDLAKLRTNNRDTSQPDVTRTLDGLLGDVTRTLENGVERRAMRSANG